MEKKVFEQMADVYFESLRNLRKACIQYLNDVMEDKSSLDVSDLNATVVYDGGNHPEYASNAFSHVESVYKEDGNIFLRIEDCKKYWLDDADTEGLYNLCSEISEM